MTLTPLASLSIPRHATRESSLPSSREEEGCDFSAIDARDKIDELGAAEHGYSGSLPIFFEERLMIRALCVGSVVLSLTGVAQAGEHPPVGRTKSG